MSTIACPRESSLPRRQIPQIHTPTGSSRASIDSPWIGSSSPNRGPAPRRNRAALREYYNIKSAEAESGKGDIDDASSEYSINDQSDVQESEMDQEGFDGEVYVKRVLETQNLQELLRTYNGVLTDIRALDAEKKALVYDNYSKLIAATETIRKMRANMDPLNPMASTLDPAIAQIYERANAAKADLRASMTLTQHAEAEMSEEDREKAVKKRKAKDAVRKVLDTPERLRTLVADGNEEDARNVWEPVLRVLENWKEQGKGGMDVQDCIDDGEAALRGEPPNERSWVNIKAKR
ncbi:hypothetical protein VC83_07229 [Pseudogymnoascus destructans]|uniref:Vacuolar protein sorting-associated protein 51 homolog n=2 Tax=Pseudogymnoascus destructans TaxID=655981 RepID=L8GAK6_PSED2|nr:uncharacterized protein VC83_07229 [Pseudogymnoascus destructans]ELR09934.1 hypothetical protein GMDG_04410 [Pseudogymnoascus destructans 20631-21]OAF56539.1 hypothetical protein VC83_07229 [Pseudogymnoascus destructans]